MNERADVENLNLVYPQFKRESVRSVTQTSWAQVSANFGPVLYQIVSNRQYMYLPLMWVDLRLEMES